MISPGWGNRMKLDRKFVCRFCHRPFVREDRYIAHKCKEMKRHEEFRTPTGQAAWIYYQEWMKSYKRAVPMSSTFLESKYYRTFIKFAEFVTKVGLPDTKKFIWLMREKEIQPALWTNSEVYSMYLEFLDMQSTPMEQVKITLKTLIRLAEDHNVDISQIFETVTPNQLITLLHQKRISPWFLLCSRAFKRLLVERTNDEQKVIFETIIRADYWAEKFQEHPEIVQKIKQYVSELNL